MGFRLNLFRSSITTFFLKEAAEYLPRISSVGCLQAPFGNARSSFSVAFFIFSIVLKYPLTQNVPHERIRKRGGVQKSMGNKVPWKTGVLIYLHVTSRPLMSLQQEAVLSPCNFATTHLKACILNFDLPQKIE